MNRVAASLVLLALLLTVLNSLKPLTMDDAAYYYYARQLAWDATDPYGFEIFWYQRPMPANYALAPPVIPYWWSLAIRLFGDVPVLWKLWLFPFALLLVCSLYRLARRFARGAEWPLVVGMIFSPVVLPGMNLMLDVPALALALSAMVLFQRACDRCGHATARREKRSSVCLALVAGLVIGLATQTKYTSFMTLAAMIGFACLQGRLRLGLLMASTALVVFGLWEGFITYKYGQPHFWFLAQVLRHYTFLDMVDALPRLLGSAAGVGVLFLSAALGFGGLGLSLAGLLVGFAYFLPVVCGDGSLFLGLDETTQTPLFTSLGWLWLAGTATVAVRLNDPIFGASNLRWKPRFRSTDRFLASWFLLELVGYFVLSPFPGVRRILGIVTVGSLLAARLASRTCGSPHGRTMLLAITAANVLSGLLIYSVDLVEALALKHAAEESAAWVRTRDADGKVWYVGHWGFQFYAERAGFEPVVPRESLLRRGDWLVLPTRLNQQVISLPEAALELKHRLVIDDALPLRTVSCYYGGKTALEHRSRHRWVINICRVTTDSVPSTELAPL